LNKSVFQSIESTWNQPLQTEEARGNFTLGNWETEQESSSFFDGISAQLEKQGLWKSESEVSGAYMNCLPMEERQGCRIDRILYPGQKMVDAGWCFGPIGIELKRSRERLGRPASQCIDYRNAIFTSSVGTQFVLQQVFLWPLLTWGGGELESVMGQRRVGGVFFQYDKMRFYLGQQLVLDVGFDGKIVEFKQVFMKTLGRKKGNRG
jgi:hypothetical protein